MEDAVLDALHLAVNLLASAAYCVTAIAIGRLAFTSRSPLPSALWLFAVLFGVGAVMRVVEAANPPIYVSMAFLTLTVIIGMITAALMLFSMSRIARQHDAVRKNFELTERFRALVEHIHDYAIYMLDVDGNVKTWNVGAERIKGYRAEEVLGQNVSMFYTAEDRANDRPLMDLHRAFLASGARSQHWEVRKGGERFWASTSLTPIHNITGKLLGYSRITQDRTEQKAAHTALEDKKVELENQVRARIMLEEEITALRTITAGQSAQTVQTAAAVAKLKGVTDALERMLQEGYKDHGGDAYSCS
jgi:PAS domain S-box-containing protein